MKEPERNEKAQQKCPKCRRIVGCGVNNKQHKCKCKQNNISESQKGQDDMNEMDMALEMINAIEELPIDDFITEYNRIMNKNVKKEDVLWNEFPVYYNPDVS